MKNKTRSKETRSVFSIILNKPLARALLLAVLLAAAGFTAYSIAFPNSTELNINKKGKKVKNGTNNTVE